MRLFERPSLALRGFFDQGWGNADPGLREKLDARRVARASGDTRDPLGWGGAAFVGEHLLVAAGADGLAHLDCSALVSAERDVSDLVERWDAASGSFVAMRQRSWLDEPRLTPRYLRFGDGVAVLDVIPVEAHAGALVIVEQGGARRAVWHPVGGERG